MNARTIASIIVLLAFGVAVVTQLQNLRQLVSRLGPKWANLDPSVKNKALGVIARTERDPLFKDEGLKVGIFDGWRSLADQQTEIDDNDSFVRSALSSFHPWGLAVDFVFIDRAGRWTFLDEQTDSQFGGNARLNPNWQRLGQHIKAEGFEWGGDFSSIFDGPHAQLRVGGLGPRELQARFGTPEEFLAGRGVLVA